MKFDERKNQKIKFLFEQGIIQKDFYIKNTHSGIERLTKLFPVFPSSITVKVFRNRCSFLKAIHKKKAPDWLVAYIPQKSTSSIYVFNNKKKLTVKQTTNYHQLLLHEITHLYINTLNPNLPDWLKEGISVYVAGQIPKLSISTNDWIKITQGNTPFKGLSWRVAAKYNGYIIAGLLVAFFVKRYGWKKFIIAISCSDSERFFIKTIPLYFGERAEQLIADFKKRFVK